jgi:HlyD family secretion protein
MKRIVAILFVVLVIAGSWYLYSQGRQPTEPQVPPGTTTAPVERTAIESIVSATGSVAAERVANLIAPGSGTVAAVLVQEGDQVTAGQVVARLDTSDLELNLKQAQAQLQVSEASLARSRKAPSAEEIKAAEAGLASANANLENLKKGPSTTDQQLARMSIDQAKNSLWGAQGNRDAVKGSPVSGGGAKAQAEAQVANAELGVKIAEVNYQKLFEPVAASQVTAAESQIAQAESTLARLLSTPSQEDIAVAEAQVAQAQVAVQIAQKHLADAAIKAPFSAEMTTLNIHPGDIVAPNAPVATLLDSSRYHISVDIDETEITQVHAGQAVRVELDAFPAQEIEGTVSRIDPLGASSQGLVNYRVRVDVSPSELPIRQLMTASIRIVVAEKQNVLVVPNRAIKRDSQGRYVEILQAAVPTKAYVTTGASNEDVTEIVDGLEQGQQVIISRPRVNPMAGSFGGN